MKTRAFGKLSDGRSAGLYILRNSSDMEASVTDYGAALVSLIVPDRNSRAVDVVLGYDDAAGYERGHGSIGATVGRFANRIGGAAFELGGTRYELTANNGPNCLHGGRDPYNKRLWSAKLPFTKVSSGDVAAAFAAESISDRGPSRSMMNLEGRQVTFCLDSPDGDQGFPGNLHIEVSYTLTDEGDLHIDYAAISDADTPLNLTNHSYFNLNGHDSGSVLGHLCHVEADSFTPVDENTLPTGELRQTRGTPFDFSVPASFAGKLREGDRQIALCGGFDHNYVLRGEGYRRAAELYSDRSGIAMTVSTDLPGMQLYTANGMSDEAGKGGCVYGRFSGACFETQFWPDSVNREEFPGGILRAGETFRSRTTYSFTHK